MHDFSILESCDGVWSGRLCEMLKLAVTAVITVVAALYMLLRAEWPVITLRHLSPPPTWWLYVPRSKWVTDKKRLEGRYNPS